MSNVNLSKGIKTILCFFFLSANFLALASAESEVITTIILINREAELVDLDEQGEVLKRYVAIPDYFSSGRSHNSSLRKSLAQLKDYGYEKDFSIPGSSDLAAEDLQSYMMKPRKKTCQTISCLLPFTSPDSIKESKRYPFDQTIIVASAYLSQNNEYTIKPQATNSSHNSFIDKFYPRIIPDAKKQHQRGLSRSRGEYIIWNVYT